MPLSCLNTFTSKQLFDQFLVRSDRLEQVKLRLGEEISKNDKLGDQFDEICEEAIRKIQDIHRAYRAKIHFECQSLKEKVKFSITETEKMIVSPEYVTQDDLATFCWSYIIKQIGDFETTSLSAMRKKEKYHMRQFRTCLNSLLRCVQEECSPIAFFNAEMELRQYQFRATTTEYSKKMLETASLSNLPSQIMTATLCCCAPFCLCWPLVGLWQAMNNDNLDKTWCGCDIFAGAYICILPTLFCCVGAALNRSAYMQKAGLKTSFLVDLSLFSMHIWNACLVCQETEVQKAHRGYGLIE